MATLKNEHKIFIVQQLACFRSPAEVVDLAKSEFGLEVDRRQVGFYDPSNKNSSLSGEFRLLFEKTRQAFLTETVNIGIAHPAYRLHQLQAIFDRHSSAPRKNDQMLMSILKQAAEETGGMFDQELKLADHRAKLSGTYTNPKENPETSKRQQQVIEDLIKRFVDRDGLSREQAIAEIVRVKPEAKEWLN